MLYEITKIKFLREYRTIEAGEMCLVKNGRIHCGVWTFDINLNAIAAAQKIGLIKVYAKVKSD